MYAGVVCGAIFLSGALSSLYRYLLTIVVCRLDFKEVVVCLH